MCLCVPFSSPFKTTVAAVIRCTGQFVQAGPSSVCLFAFSFVRAWSRGAGMVVVSASTKRVVSLSLSLCVSVFNREHGCATGNKTGQAAPIPPTHTRDHEPPLTSFFILHSIPARPPTPSPYTHMHTSQQGSPTAPNTQASLWFPRTTGRSCFSGNVPGTVPITFHTGPTCSSLSTTIFTTVLLLGPTV